MATFILAHTFDIVMFGYAVEITGRKGHAVIGNAYELGDYYSHSMHVRETALILDSVTLTYSDDWGVNAGKKITVPRYEYDGDHERQTEHKPPAVFSVRVQCLLGILNLESHTYPSALT